MKFLFYIFTFILFFSGCGSSSTSLNKHTIKSLTVNDVEALSSVTLKLENSDKIKSYTWWDENGTFLGNTPVVKWKAPAKKGRYTVSVDTVDVNEKKSTTSITINVIENSNSSSNGRPIIQLIGEKNITLSLGEEYEESGATSYDEEDGDLTDDIVISGEVDIYTPGKYVLTYSSTDSDNHTTIISRVITVVQTYVGPFSKIKKLIKDASDGKLSDVTYICVGDSTRAESIHEGQYLFYEIRDKLATYGVDSRLLAKAGHTAKRFDLAQDNPTYKNVIDNIPADGSHAIVSISLGINDYWDKNYNFKSNIKSAISKIKLKKPNTNFILTVPNRVYNDDTMTNYLEEAYKSLSNELNLPLINIVEDIMPTPSSTQASWYINDGFYVHLSKEGQHLVAQDILSKILP
jgi:lysophospholipase L1-like esterase